MSSQSKNNSNNIAVYIIAIRDENAKEKLTNWLASHRHASARVEEHRLQIYDQNTMNLFAVTWTHSLNNVTIWDCWNRRHIYLD
jgi:hypothetical protein